MRGANLPREIQHGCILLVRGYERCHKEYIDQRMSIIHGSGNSLQEGRSRGRWAGGRTIEAKAAELEVLEKQRWVIEMHALERARDRIGAGMPEEMRETLQAAIMLNCINGRAYPFERLFTVGISRRGFYRYREAFLHDIANELTQMQRNYSAEITD